MNAQIQQVAVEALDLKLRIDNLTKELESKKDVLRQAASGDLMELTVEGKGKIRVSRPREAKEDEIIVINHEKLEVVPELKAALLQKGVLKKEMKKVAGAKASVTVELNV